MESPAIRVAGNGNPASVESVMNPVNNVGGNSPASAVNKIVAKPVQKQIPTDAPTQLPATDKLELSGVSHLLKALKSNDIRGDKVAEIRAQLDANTYEDDKKLDIAVDRLLDDLLK
jgi:hypothetical protein